MLGLYLFTFGTGVFLVGLVLFKNKKKEIGVLVSIAGICLVFAGFNFTAFYYLPIVILCALARNHERKPRKRKIMPTFVTPDSYDKHFGDK